MELGGFILAVVITLIAVVVFVSVAVLRSRKQAWMRFAHRHGLSYQASGATLQVHGTVNGRPFRLFTPDESSDVGELGVQEVRMQLGLRGHLPADTRMSCVAGLVGMVDRLTEAQAVLTGDEQFDQKIFVQSGNPDQVRKYLTPGKRELILKLAADSGAQNAGIDGNELFVQDREMLTDVNRIEQRLRLMLSLAPGLDAGD